MTVQPLGSGSLDELIAGGLPLLVKFGAEWCGPCKKLAPVLRRLSEDYAGNLLVVDIDVDTRPDLGREYNIGSVPTIFIMNDGNRFEVPQNHHTRSAIVDYLAGYGIEPVRPA